jgi:hypothetical protein
MSDHHTAPLSYLIERCQEETMRYLRTHVLGDDSYCLELFRRAIQDGDEQAWAFIYTFYSTEDFLGEHYLLKWVRSWLNGRHGAVIRSAFTEEEMVQEVWLRLMHSEAARTFSFASMSHLMAFVRRLINNLALDAARRRVPDVVEPMTEDEAIGLDYVLGSVPDSHAAVEEVMARQEAMDALLKEVVDGVLTTTNEWLVFRGYFLEDLPPRKLYTLYPGVFAPGEVETTRTRLARRLRKAPYLLSRYVQVVVLADDERLALIFQHTLIEGWPDRLLLDRYPHLFSDQGDVFAAKIQVLRAIRNRPALMHLLARESEPSWAGAGTRDKTTA